MKKKWRELVQSECDNQSEFKQIITGFIEDIEETYENNKVYQAANVIDRIVVPDRIIFFKVVWEDDAGQLHVNHAWRVQYSNALGPYKGGLRFHPSVNENVFKFLAFEQTLKCALTGLPMGGAKGGSDFNPKGKSDKEVKRFCQSLMQELHHYIGTEVDIPAGDIGVGVREISYLFGHYVKLSHRFSGVLTGKHPSFGGSCGREEATGYGCIFFLDEMLKAHNHKLKKTSILISGAGNVALHAAEKAIQKEMKVLSLSDTSGTIHFKSGMNEKQIKEIKDYKLNKRESLESWAKKSKDKEIEFLDKETPWALESDVALPCARENEMELSDVKKLIKNGVFCIAEGANMPLTNEAVKFVEDHEVIYAPGKIVNAGGVAVSNFERTQNSSFTSWSLEKVEKDLCKIMHQIHNNCASVLEKNGHNVIRYKKASNILAFKKLADALSGYEV